MHSSYSHFSWFCYPDSFKLHPTIQYTHQLRVPAKNHFNYYFTIIKSFRKLPYSLFRTPIFKLTDSNLNSYDQPWLQGSTSQSNIGTNSNTEGKDRNLCLSQ